MQIAQEVRRVLSKKPEKVLGEQFEIPFVIKGNKEKPPELTKEEIDRRASIQKAIWKTRIANSDGK